MKRVILASTEVGIDESRIDELLQSNLRRALGPNRYLYAICEYLGWRPPMFMDNAARGVRIKYGESTQEAAEQTLVDIQKAADALGIPVYNATTKPGPQHRYYAYCVVPKYYTN